MGAKHICNFCGAIENMEKLDCMYVHGSKINDPHLAASLLATAMISAI